MDLVAVRQDLSFDCLAAVHHQQDGLVMAGNCQVVQKICDRALSRERYVQAP